jgi:hypothetical protein
MRTKQKKQFERVERKYQQFKLKAKSDSIGRRYTIEIFVA